MKAYPIANLGFPRLFSALRSGGAAAVSDCAARSRKHGEIEWIGDVREGVFDR
jgi:hypothetical protein